MSFRAEDVAAAIAARQAKKKTEKNRRRAVEDREKELTRLSLSLSFLKKKSLSLKKQMMRSLNYSDLLQ